MVLAKPPRGELLALAATPPVLEAYPAYTGNAKDCEAAVFAQSVERAGNAWSRPWLTGVPRRA